MVFNEFSLVRWPDGAPIPGTSLSMTLDADSNGHQFRYGRRSLGLPLITLGDKLRQLFNDFDRSGSDKS
jgi:hypothetical protein